MPKILGSTLTEHRRKVREKLFAALAELMGERGFDSITLAQIANRARVGRTSVYNHFPDKESLLLAFIEHETATFVENLHTALSGITDPQEQLRIYVQEQLQLQHSYHFAPGPELRTLVSQATIQQLREHVHDVALVLRSILTAGISAGQFPPQDLESVVPLVHSCLQGRSLPSDPTARAQAVETTTQFVLRAVGAREYIAA